MRVPVFQECFEPSRPGYLGEETEITHDPPSALLTYTRTRMRR